MRSGRAAKVTFALSVVGAAIGITAQLGVATTALAGAGVSTGKHTVITTDMVYW